MEEIRSSAIVYYEKLPKVEQQLAENLFQNLDVYRDGKIGFQVYKAQLKEEEKHMKQLTDPRFFKNLDRNKDGLLDKQDILTLFYLAKSGRLRFCDSCEEFLIGRFFPCSQCFYSSTDGSYYKLCGSCYGAGTFSHHHDNAKFVANDLLQRRQESQSGNSVQPNNSNIMDRKQTLVYNLMTATASNFIARELVIATAGASSGLFDSSPPVPDSSAGAASILFGSPVPDPSAASNLVSGGATNSVPDPSGGSDFSSVVDFLGSLFTS